MNERRLTFVHRLVSGKGKSAGTTLLLLHGTGGSENDLLDLGHLVFPGATMLSPRGKVLENGMPRFFRRLAVGVFDVDDLQRRTHELADFVRDACEAYSLDARQVVGVGYSNGANIAASTLLLRPEALAAAVLLRPMVPFLPKQFPDLRGKEVFVAAGRHDPVASAAETQRLMELLSAADAAVQVHWQDGGHELGHEDITAAQTWLSSLARRLDATRDDA